MIGIYKITSPSGKVYIGQSVDIKKRWEIHRRLYDLKDYTKLKRSLAKYGVEAHQFDIIEECIKEQLNEREMYWGECYDTLGPNGLNLKLGNAKGKTSEETKEKIRKANTGKKRTEEQVNKLRIPRTEEFKLSLRGKKKPPRTKEHSLNLSLSLKGNGKGKPKPEGFGEMISKVRSKPVIQYTLEGEFIKEWKNKEEAEVAMKCRHIRCIINKENRTAVGFIWKYKHQ